MLNAQNVLQDEKKNEYNTRGIWQIESKELNVTPQKVNKPTEKAVLCIRMGFQVWNFCLMNWCFDGFVCIHVYMHVTCRDKSDR